MSIALKNPSELLGRIGASPSERLLLVDAPEELERLLASARPDGGAALESVPADRLRAVKDDFDVVLVWREDRVGSQALLGAALRRLRAAGAIWVVTAMRKVTGPRTPAAHRLERRDLEKAFAASGLALDREARFSAWHVGYRFRRSSDAATGGPREPEGYST